jgi:hypothetical protein
MPYAPQLAEANRLYYKGLDRAKGYTNEYVEDESTIKFITEFEKTLPLKDISLVEFERRIKKLVTPKMQDCCTVGMIIECFKDHFAF